MRPGPETGGEALKSIDLSHHGADFVGRNVQFQLSQPADVNAAHQFIQPTGGELHLPHFPGFTSGAAEAASVHAAVVPGSESSAIAGTQQIGNGAIAGANQIGNGAIAGANQIGNAAISGINQIGNAALAGTNQIGNAAIAGANQIGNAALATAHQVGNAALLGAQQVGNQAISPIIQMIMRMPGHIGLISSFFEALSHFFAPIHEALGALDPTLLAEQAESALHSTTSSLSEHLSVDLEMLPEDAPILENLGEGAGASLGESVHGALGGHLDLNNFNPSDNLSAGREAMNVSGLADLSHPQFEHSGMESIYASGHEAFPGSVDQQYLAMDNGVATFRPTVGGMHTTIPNSAQPAADPASTASQPAQSAQPAAQPHPASHAAHHVAHARDAGHEGGHHGNLLGHPRTRLDQPAEAADGKAGDAQAGTDQAQAGTDQAQAEAQESSTSYTVKDGDNLWDIAKSHLGDANRWHEIYQMNGDSIGADPRMIHAGTELKLPGSGSEIASNEYVVKPGDSLWDISKSQLGGGEHWHDLYQHNTDIVGENPSLIHPGQHLSLTSDNEQIASADTSSHITQSVHHAPTTHVAHHAHSETHLASSNTHGAHADHSKIAHADNHLKVAHGQPATQVAAGSQQVPEQLASSPSGAGEQIALKSAQPMGSLQPVANPTMPEAAAAPAQAP